MPEISVILPTRDRPTLLSRALASVLAQQDVDFEVIVVDNNQVSPVDPACGGDPRVRVVRAPGARTAGAARNAGLAAATGHWLAFLDDDDEYAPGKLVRQLATARATGASLVLCGYQVPLRGRCRTIQTDRTLFVGDARLLNAIYGTPFLFVRRETDLWFDESLEAAEDLHFAQRWLRAHGWPAVPCVPAPLVVVHPQPTVRVNRNHEAHWRALRRVLREYGAAYSPPARRRFLLRALLQRHKGPDGSWRRLIGVGIRLVLAGEPRRVGNAWLLRTGWFDRWLVS